MRRVVASVTLGQELDGWRAHGNVFEVDLPGVPLALRDGENIVAIAFEVDGIRSSRTLMLRHGNKEVE